MYSAPVLLPPRICSDNNKVYKTQEDHQWHRITEGTSAVGRCKFLAIETTFGSKPLLDQEHFLESQACYQDLPWLILGIWGSLPLQLLGKKHPHKKSIWSSKNIYRMASHIPLFLGNSLLLNHRNTLLFWVLTLPLYQLTWENNWTKSLQIHNGSWLTRDEDKHVRK